VTVPSPLEFKKVADAVEAESATILIGTPTFLKPYIRHVAPEKLKSLKYAIAGAEKTPAGFADLWQATFDCLYFEGYGLTETSPVVSINLPHTPSGFDCSESATDGPKPGSVGRLMPGHAARILNPDTMQPLAVTEVGLLLLKGPNIFSGYLNDAKRTAEVMDGEWFITGDLARFDKVEAFDLLDAEIPMLAIGARPDAAKGEALVLLAVIDVELTDVRTKLSAAGYSNLWIPKLIKRVAAIPTLATGKLDLRAIKALSEAE
jgi:acyl-[acyl-carrier-protein]-phospholipid O-acyltransferase/long-chain-fatty-acid--[acyl-carrier-protein] ligase